MENEKTPRMEESGYGQQVMQERIAQTMEMVTNLIKEKGITNDSSLQKEPTSRGDGIDPFIVSNQNDSCEQEELRKNPSKRPNHVDMQQRCSLLNKKLKEIEGVNDLGSVDPRELCLVLDLVIPPSFKMPKFEKYDGTKCPENHLATYCNKMAGHARNEDLLIHVFFDSLAGTAAQWYMGLKRDQIRT